MSEPAYLLFGIVAGMSVILALIGYVTATHARNVADKTVSASKMAQECVDHIREDILQRLTEQTDILATVKRLANENAENFGKALEAQQKQLALLERDLNALRDRPPGTPSTTAPWRNVHRPQPPG